MKTIFTILILETMFLFDLRGQEIGKASVQPAIAACPKRVKAPVDSGLLGKIIVPYDNSLFIKSDQPYFLGDSYVPRSSRERAQYQIIP